MRRAAKTDRNHGEVMDAFRRLGCAVYSAHAIGGGFPDLICASARLGTFLVEVKDGSLSPSRRKLTSDQLEFHRTWPLPIFIVASVAEVAEVVQKLEARA